MGGNNAKYYPFSGGFYNMLYRHLAENASLEITPTQVRQQIAVIEECHRQNKFG